MKHVHWKWLFLLLFAVETVDAQDLKRPNILLLMSDNQYARHLGVYGDKTVKTPNVDVLAAKGIRFSNAFCASPSCTPSRAGILTGQDVWRLKEGANLWGSLPAQLPTYVDLLEQHGYSVGYSGKGWGPGYFKAGGRTRNPAGNLFQSFNTFLQSIDHKKPWTFWFSSREPHRPYPAGSGKAAGISTNGIEVPPYLPDNDSVRSDIADYYAAVQEFDKEVGVILQHLEKSGMYDNTVIVICSDNGWQMPRGLANVYDVGTHVPLIVAYNQWRPQRVYDDFVNLNDLAPTFLELAGVKIPEAMTARSLLPLLKSSKQAGRIEAERNAVYMARERHAYARSNGLGYPVRAIRTEGFLYVHNYAPERWPAGDPPLYGDVDAHMLHYPSLSKVHVIKAERKADSIFYQWAFAKRPAEELYDLKKDPYQLHNIADDAVYLEQKTDLKERLEVYLRKTKDPRAVNEAIVWDAAPYYNERDKTPKPSADNRRALGLDSIYYYLPKN